MKLKLLQLALCCVLAACGGSEEQECEVALPSHKEREAPQWTVICPEPP